jgi:hypothetical protein
VIKNIIPEKLNDVKELQNVLMLVLNRLKKLLQENTELKVTEKDNRQGC